MDIWDRALGFMDSQVLLTAEELGVFNALDERPRTTAELAVAAKLPPRSAQRLLTALCSLELVERHQDGRYSNSSQAAAQLVAGKPGYIGGLFRHIREDLYPVWQYFREALEEENAQWEREARHNGGVLKNERNHEDPAALRAFMRGMHAVTYQAGRELAGRAPELAQIESIVDVGGAGGSFLIALCRQFPKLRGTVFDLPNAQPIAEELIAEHELSDRIGFRGGSFFTDPLPAGRDAYSLGFILHDWDTHGDRLILDNVAQACPTGGVLIVGEYLLDEDRTGPLHVARMDLNMLVAARGQERTTQEYRDLLEQSGFALRNIYPTSHGKAFLVAEKG